VTTPNDDKYLRPSELCDFDICPEIEARALELTRGCKSREEMFRSLFNFVKELPYGLEDWDVTASETLAKGWGMCAGKTNLLVAMLRSLGIRARYRAYRIRSEVSLWGAITGDEEMAQRMGDAPVEQDHVDCEVWLGGWVACDPSRDTPMERGMIARGIPLEREQIIDDSGHAPCLFLSDFDGWARERQSRRRFRKNRGEIFAKVNELLSRMRVFA